MASRTDEGSGAIAIGNLNMHIIVHVNLFGLIFSTSRAIYFFHVI